MNRGDQTWSALAPGQIHLWQIHVAEALALTGQVESYLSPDEITRAAGLHFERDRARFIARRGVLRRILGRYVGLPPSELRFTYGARGKPALDWPQGRAGAIPFNLSTTDDLVLYAVMASGNIGVDVAKLSAVTEPVEIARAYYSRAEADAIAQLPPAERVRAFLAAWTCKEAYLKATAVGMSLPMDQVEVALGADGAPALVAIAGDAREAARWIVLQPAIGANYAASVVAEANGPEAIGLQIFMLTRDSFQ
jgi:4'-phosphopantetheinyl transferase